ncbi:MAG TPA: MmgE/PrpD family protein [Dehalococcoidia bacterium]|nr:MmgE/PrpD family protein [Dehalococcoidia bacterium]
MKITQRLAEFVANRPPDAIAQLTREHARRAILDTLGVMLAGTREDASSIVAQITREQGGAEEATVLGYGFRAPAGEAALINGMSGHALDFDDVSMSMRGHPSVPLLPAVLALGEKLGSSGRDVMDAFVLGFEVECKLGRLIGGPHYALGWHATSTFGTVGAAVACARLLRLDAARTQTALAIAASLASGVRQNFGSMTKPLHAGWAARNGVLAATLAECGLTADAEALEGESGFLRAASGGSEFDPSPLGRLGDPWEIVSPGVGVKLYPCCYATHRAIDAALALRPAIERDLAGIESVRVSVSPGTPMPLRTTLPNSGLEGKFSMEYCIATALHDGHVTLASFSDNAVARPHARSLMSKVTMIEDGPAANFPIQGTARVSVQFRDREPAHSPLIEVPRGDPQNPLSWDELRAKFRDCTATIIDPDGIEAAIRSVEEIDSAHDIHEVTRVIAPAGLVVRG